MTVGWNPLEHCDGSGETHHVDDCPCPEHGGRVAECTCSDVDDSDVSAAALDDPDCPIHGWDDDGWDDDEADEFVSLSQIAARCGDSNDA